MKEFVEKLIESLEEWSFETEIVIQGSDGYDDTANRKIICTQNAIEIVNKLAEEYVPDTNVRKWIPCSYKMPEEESNAIITTKAGNVMVGMYTKKYGQRMSEGFICDDYFVYMCSVVAWMPLPEPYKPEEPKEIPSNYYMERFEKVI